MKRLLIVLLVVVAIMGLVSFAAAADAGGLDQAVTGIVDEILSMLVIVLMGFVTLAVKKAAEYFGIKITADKQIMIQAAASRAVSFVEERAQDYAKKQIDGLSSGSDKLDAAISQIVNSGIKVSRDQAHEFIEAELARMDGVGSTGTRTVK